MNLTVKTIRLWNARYLADQLGTIAAFGNTLGKSQAQVGNFIGKNPVRNIGDSVARQIEKAFSKRSGWLDQAHPDLWATIEYKEWKHQLEEEFGAQPKQKVISEEPDKYLGQPEPGGDDLDLFTKIVEAVSDALDSSGLDLTTKELLEVSKLFYDMEIKQPPKKAVVIDLVSRLKKASAGG